MATDDAAHLPRPDPRRFEAITPRRKRLQVRLRMQYLAGAEEEHRLRTGHQMTVEELEQVLLRYPGDA